MKIFYVLCQRAGYCSRPEFFRRVLRFTSREFAGIPSLKPNSFKVFLLSVGRLVGQFLHSLAVNPCTPTRIIQYAEKILMAAHNPPCAVRSLKNFHL